MTNGNYLGTLHTVEHRGARILRSQHVDFELWADCRTTTNVLIAPEGLLKYLAAVKSHSRAADPLRMLNTPNSYYRPNFWVPKSPQKRLRQAQYRNRQE